MTHVALSLSLLPPVSMQSISSTLTASPSPAHLFRPSIYHAVGQSLNLSLFHPPDSAQNPSSAASQHCTATRGWPDREVILNPWPHFLLSLTDFFLQTNHMLHSAKPKALVLLLTANVNFSPTKRDNSAKISAIPRLWERSECDSQLFSTPLMFCYVQIRTYWSRGDDVISYSS